MEGPEQSCSLSNRHKHKPNGCKRIALSSGGISTVASLDEAEVCPMYLIRSRHSEHYDCILRLLAQVFCEKGSIWMKNRHSLGSNLSARGQMMQFLQTF